MELLGDKFSFMECIEEENAKLTQGQVVNPHDIIDELALSPAVKRAVWQALRIVDEVAHIKKALPSRIFVEVARTNKSEKKKKDSRQKRLSDLYSAIKKDDVLQSLSLIHILPLITITIDSLWTIAYCLRHRLCMRNMLLRG